MNITQELTPKYWVGHDPKSDDVFLYTAAKSWDDTDKKLRQVCDNYEEQGLVISLIEIKLVSNFGSSK